MTDNFHTITDEWNHKLEEVIIEISKKCAKNKATFMNYAQKSLYRYNIMMYSLIVLGPISGILSTVNSDHPAIGICASILGFATGTISAVIKFSDYQEKTLTYKTLANKYSSLETNISRQLTLSKKDRVNAGKYLEWVTTSYQELFNIVPVIEHSLENGALNEIKTENNKLAPDKVDLQKYTDGLMAYELDRMNRINKQ
jgi:hypothetical protein